MAQHLESSLKTGMKSLSYTLGIATLVFAAIVAGTSWRPSDVAEWVLRVFGISFVSFLCLLLIISAFAVTQMVQACHKAQQRRFWLEVGLHGANGISTLALTYTLLGISLGIGSLADQNITPQTVQLIIKELTRHFSMAFMTTVVGLPLSALVRAILLLCEERILLKNSSSVASMGETS